VGCRARKGTPEAAERAIKLFKEKAVAASPSNPNYLTTYGAVLYRGGEREKAIEQLKSATKAWARWPSHFEDQKGYGNAVDLLFTAMAQYPEQAGQARKALVLADQIIQRLEAIQHPESPDQSLTQVWNRLERVWNRLELEILRDEAKSVIDP
jgi:hypothetical protein